MKRMMAVALFFAGSAAPLLAQESEVERMKREVENLKAANSLLVRQLEVQSAQLKDLQNLPRPKASVIPGPVLPSPTLPPSLSSKSLSSPLTTTLTAIAPEIGLVVLSVGKEDGVREGQEFQISRGGDFVAKVVIDRCDQKWSAGKITLKKSDPKVGDQATAGTLVMKPGTQERLETLKISLDLENATISETLTYLSEVTGLRFELDPAVLKKVDPARRGTTFKVADLTGANALKLLTSNLRLDYRVTDDGRVVLTLPPQAGVSAPSAAGPLLGHPQGESAEELRRLRKELDDVRSQVRLLSDHLIPAWQEEGVATEELSEALRAQLNLQQGLLLRQVREGSRAEKLGLRPLDVVRELDEAQLLRILREGGQIVLYRQGKMLVYQVDRSR